MAWGTGQGGGWACGDVLAGRSGPQGRRVVSVPKSAGAMPYYYNHKLKSGGTPFAFHFGSRYPFGFGLGWTQFSWGATKVAASSVPVDGEVTLNVDITNTGERSGSEVVQVYVRDKVATQVRPLQELKAFQRVTLSPGETATLTVTLPVEMVNFTRRDGKRIVEPGEFELQVGASSADIRDVVTVDVTGETRVLAGEWKMMSRCEVTRG